MSSNLCSCTAASTTLTGTLTGGIQDIAALLPLLGTEQCEDHVSSALTKGYLYAAASPMSLFGSLGLARAGLKTFLASFSIPEWDIVGARTLLNMGFKPLGMNLSVIMIDPNDKEGRYLIETRLDKLVEELHIDKTKIENVQHTSIRWNARMMTLSTILCMLSMVPYIFLNVKTSNSLPHNTRWTFPALRAAGGFLTTAMMQVIIQRRTTTLARRWISKHGTLYPRVPNRGFDPFQNMPYIVRKSLITLRGIGQIFRCSMTPRRFKNDVEMGLNVTATDSNSLFTWCLLALLLLGVLSSVVGYVGCFSVVQNASGSNALIWFCLESGLSLLRMFLWGLNPGFDNAPPLKLILARDRYPPLPTCKLYDHDIVTEKVLPLTRANQFLNSITSFTGVVDHFDHPDVTLYYTLTRSAVPHADSQNAAQLHEPGDHVLYITIFDHKERANTRVYMRRNGIDRFYATESNLPVIDLKQGLLEIKLGDEIDSHDDPITSDHDIRSQLNAHYRSIMDQIHFAMGQPTFLPRYKIENKWTMAMVHTTSTPQTEGEIEATRVYPDARVSLRDFLYLQHGRLENNCRTRRGMIAMQLRRTYCDRDMRQLCMGGDHVPRRVRVEEHDEKQSTAGAITGGTKPAGTHRVVTKGPLNPVPVKTKGGARRVPLDSAEVLCEVEEVLYESPIFFKFPCVQACLLSYIFLFPTRFAFMFSFFSHSRSRIHAWNLSQEVRVDGIVYLDTSLPSPTFLHDSLLSVFANPTQPVFLKSDYAYTYPPYPSPESIAAWESAPESSRGPLELWVFHGAPKRCLDWIHLPGLMGCEVQRRKVAKARPKACVRLWSFSLQLRRGEGRIAG